MLICSLNGVVLTVKINDMNGEKVSRAEIRKMLHLRETGHSLPEISMVIGRGKGTVHRYVKDTQVLSKYRETLRVKQGGSKERALRGWSEAKKKASALILPIQKRDRLLILTCLYWGEGNKKDLNIINSDPLLIKTFINCLREIGVTRSELKITIRLYEDIDKDKALRYWAGIVGIPKEKIFNVNILKGKKVGKLEYGMCRIRVTKGAKHFKLILSMIDLIKSEII